MPTQTRPKNRLTDEQVRLILTSPKTNKETGKQFGVSDTFVSNIRTGKAYASVCPDLPRRRVMLSRQSRTKLFEDDIRVILTSDKTHRELAKQFQVTTTCVSDIRHGKYRAEVLPELPRWERMQEANKGVSCRSCIHFDIELREGNKGKDGRMLNQYHDPQVPVCLIGLPEFNEAKENRTLRGKFGFARFCSCYVEVKSN